MKKRILLTAFVCLLLSSFAALASDTGWNRYYYNELSSYYNPYPSVSDISDFQEEWSSTSVSNVGYVLTGDITNDAGLEVVSHNGSQIHIFSADGDLIKTINTGDSNLARVTMLSDIDFDGYLDIGAGTSETSDLKVYFYKGNGALLKTFSYSGGYDSAMYPVGLGSDGNLIVMFGSGYSCDPRGLGKYDMVDATLEWYYDIGPSTRLQISMTDIDGDGKKEITLGNWNPHNGCSGSSGTATSDYYFYSIQIDENGNEVYTTNKTADGYAFNYFVDFNDDGDYTAVMAEEHSSSYSGTSQIHLIDVETGEITKSVSAASNGRWRLGFADVDGDGSKDIIGSDHSGDKTYVYDSNLNLLDSADTFGALVFVNDIDGDGDIEFATRNDETLYIYSASTLDLEWSFEFNSSIKNAVVSDIDLDGVNDIIAVTEDKISCLKASINCSSGDSYQEGYSAGYDAGLEACGDTSGCDLNGDGSVNGLDLGAWVDGCLGEKPE